MDTVIWQILAKLENVDYTQVLILKKQPEQQKTSTVSFSKHENSVQYQSHNGPIMALDNNNT